MKNIILISFLMVSFSFSFSQKNTYTFEFEDIDLPAESETRAICTISKDIVWASGNEGRVFLTKDGGKHWDIFSVPDCEETEFRSLHAWDTLKALVFDVTEEGRGFMTEDGGVSWKLVYESPIEGAFFNSLKFKDDYNGIAISDPVDEFSYVIKTSDGGKTWKRIENVPPGEEGEINFAASNTCIEYLPSGKIFITTGGSEARMLTSFDDGKTWEFIQTPMTYRDAKGIYSVNFINDKKGAAVGGSYQYPKAQITRSIFTTDGGKTWKASKSFPQEYRSCVVNINGNLLFAVGKTGCDYSTDFGKNWNFINSNGYYAADVVEGTNIIYVSGAEGKFAKITVSDK